MAAEAYVDEENRGICVLRHAHNDYIMFDFLRCPNRFFVEYIPSTIKTLLTYGHLDNKDIFDEKTYLISPVFVDKNHKGQGIATLLIKNAVNEFIPKGFKIGLETQNPDNVPFYEKPGFRTVKHENCEKENIHNHYMIIDSLEG